MAEYIEKKLDRILAVLTAMQVGEGRTVEDDEDEDEGEEAPAPKKRRGKAAEPEAEENDEEEEEEAPAPKKRGRPKKVTAASEHSVDDIRELCVKLSAEDKGNNKRIIALLKRFGCKKLTDMPEDEYDEFYSQLEEMGEGEEDPF